MGRSGAFTGARRRIAAFAIVVVSIIVLGTLIAEGALRLALDPRYAPRTDFEIPDARTVWANAPDLGGRYFGADFSMAIVTDAFGNRQSSLGPPRPTDPLVLVVGDSYTFGWGVDTDDTLVADLDRRMSQLATPMRAVNLGVPGYGTLAMSEHLRVFMAGIDTARVRAIVVLHADNDPVDNVEFLLYQDGLKVRSFSRASHSQWRTANLIGRVAGRWTRAAAVLPPRPGRLSWDGIDFGPIDRRTLARDGDLDATKQSDQLTPLQLQLMRLGIDRLTGVCEGCRIPIHHVILNLADHNDRYAGVLSEAFTGMSDHGNDVHFDGLARLHAHDDSVPAHNAHSGGHFTPAFNKEYGWFVFDLLGLGK